MLFTEINSYHGQEISVCKSFGLRLFDQVFSVRYGLYNLSFVTDVPHLPTMLAVIIDSVSTLILHCVPYYNLKLFVTYNF